jgi:tetratricopeptide (TPR) repeat protein
MAAPSGLAFGDNLGLTLQSIKPPSAAADGIDDKKDIRALELSETVKREMAGGQQHTYQINLNAHQFLKAIVEQDGIDVIRQVSGPDGKRLMEFDSESSLQGREEVRLVAEVTGSYQLIVRPQLGSVSDASYQIRIVELRIAAESDRALQDAHKLCEESTKLFNAGKGNEALPLLERALEIRENILEPNHRDIAFTIHSLAALYFDKSDYTKAEPLFQRALAIREKAWGPENYALAEPLNGLGDLYRHRGDCAKAEPPYMRALALTKKTLGPETPDFVKYLNGLALLYAAKGDIARAVEFRAQSNAVGERSLALHLAYGSERQKLAYLALFAKETDITLSLHNQIAPDNPQALDLAFTTRRRRSEEWGRCVWPEARVGAGRG